jgi:hypothetical protein
VSADLVIAPEAEVDIAEAYIWYEGRRAGLGEEFLSSVDACLEHIRRTPDVSCGARRLPAIADAPFPIRRVLRNVGRDGHYIRGVSHISRPRQMAAAPSLMRPPAS